MPSPAPEPVPAPATAGAEGNPPASAAPDGAARGAQPLAWLLLTVTSLCWGANAIFARLAVGEVSPMALVGLRWLFVVALLAVIARRGLVADWPGLRPHLGRIALMGAFGFTLFNAIFYAAAHYTTAVNLGILQAVMPIFIFVIAYLRFATRVTGLQVLGVIAAVAGVTLVAAHGEWQRLVALEFNIGDLMMLAACVLYAGYTVALRDRPAVAPLSFFAVLAAAAFVTSIPFVAWEWLAGGLQLPTPTGWAIIGAVGLFPSLLGQILYIRGVEIIGPGRAGLFVNLVPVIAAGLAVLFLGEPFMWFHAAALALVFGGIWMSEREGRA
jgi:drug/metabolite transporter (DMT)-like permease